MVIEYLIVLPIEPIKRNIEYSGSLPLHCTVMPWFRLGERASEVALSNKLMMVACGAENLELVSERAELFGPNRDVLVCVLTHNQQLNNMHTELLIFLAQMQSLPDHRRWIGANYRPHVSGSDGHSFQPGNRHEPKNLILIEREGGKVKHFKKAYKLGGIPF